jgi:hypothetical protein
LDVVCDGEVETYVGIQRLDNLRQCDSAAIVALVRFEDTIEPWVMDSMEAIAELERYYLELSGQEVLIGLFTPNHK